MGERLDLEEIEKACTAATPGPWVRKLAKEFGPGADNCYHQVKSMDDGKVVAKVWFPADGNDIDDDIEDRNAAFIARARQLVPALVARVRELEADLSRRNDALATLTRLDERARIIELIGTYFNHEPGVALEYATAQELVDAICARGKT